jgi:hypothetical protein
VVGVEHIVPALITHLLCPRGRAHDVCEQDCCQDTVAFCDSDGSGEEFLDAVTNLLMHEKEVILSGQFDQSCPWNVPGKKASAFHIDKRVFCAMDDQRWHMDGG